MPLKLKKKIKVLIVDDSLLFREMLKQGLSKDPDLEIVGTASDPYDARDKIIKYEPDVLTLDIEMPRMDGIDFLKKLMPQYPIPVVMVSTVSERVFEAMNAGAVDFVCKSGQQTKGMDAVMNELAVKIKIASTSRVAHWKKTVEQEAVMETVNKHMHHKVIAIGASTGGTEAILSVLKMFPRDMPGTVIVQHMPPVFTAMYAERLNRECLMEVKEAKNGDLVLQGRVLLAPGGYHMRLQKKGDSYYVECREGEKVSGHCPSVDVLFESVAQKAGKDAIGVILTGMGSDGARGLLEMRKAGGRTIGQDSTTCVVYGMPKVANELGAVERQAPLSQISQIVYGMLEM